MGIMLTELEAAKTLAVRAGAILLEHYQQPEISWKGRGDPVTQADRLASTFLVNELRLLFPEVGILLEEELEDAGRLSKTRGWIIDPLDGTQEFINRCDEFS